MPAGGGFAPAFNSRGDKTIDITRFGGVGDGVTDNYPAFTRAYASLKTKLGSNTAQRQGLIFLPGPSNFYLTSRPWEIQDPFIGIQGDDEQPEVRNTGFGPTVLLNIRTLDSASGSTVKLDASYRPNRTGVLDGSYGGYGIRGKGDASVVFTSCPLTGGAIATDGSNAPCLWGEHQYLTLQMAIVRGDGSGHVAPAGLVEHLWGFGGYDSPNILSCNKGGTAGQFDFFLTDSAGNSGTIGVFTSNPTGLLRLTLQIDLVAKTAQAWEGTTQVTATTAGAIWGGGGTGTWQRNEYASWIFFAGNNTYDGKAPVAAPGRALSDYTFYGFGLDNQKLYTTASTLTRIGGGTINDSYRYGLSGNSSRFFFLWGGDPATSPSEPNYLSSDPASSRLVTGFNYATFRVFYGYFLQVAQYTDVGGQLGNQLLNLKLTTGDTRCSPVVQWGPLVDLDVLHCKISSGFDGLVQVPTVATYKIKVRDTGFDIPGYAMNAAWTEFDVDSSVFSNSGRSILMAWASNIKIRNSDVRNVNAHCRTFLTYRGGEYGQNCVIQYFTADSEGTPCLDSPWDITQVPGAQALADLLYLDVQSAALGKPAMILRGKAGATANAQVRANAINAPGATRSALVDSDKWKGTVQVIGAAAGVQFTGTGSVGVTDI